MNGWACLCKSVKNSQKPGVRNLTPDYSEQQCVRTRIWRQREQRAWFPVGYWGICAWMLNWFMKYQQVVQRLSLFRFPPYLLSLLSPFFPLPSPNPFSPSEFIFPSFHMHSRKKCAENRDQHISNERTPRKTDHNCESYKPSDSEISSCFRKRNQISPLEI